MRARSCIVAAPLSALLALDAQAADCPPDCEVRRARDATELVVAGGYSQGVGRLRTVDTPIDHTGPGGGVSLLVGRRIAPVITVGGSAGFEAFSSPDAWYAGATDRRAAYSLRLGLDAIFHIVPIGTTDPWVQVGVGYRLLWIPSRADDTALEHGPELLRLGGGVDWWALDGVAFGPWIAADIGLLTWEDGDDIEAGAAAFFTAGVRAVFDFESMTRRSSASRSD